MNPFVIGLLEMILVQGEGNQSIIMEVSNDPPTPNIPKYSLIVTKVLWIWFEQIITFQCNCRATLIMYFPAQTDKQEDERRSTRRRKK